MSHMQPQIYEGAYFAIDTTAGVEIVPEDVALSVTGVDDVEAIMFAPYLEGDPFDSEELIPRKTGWLCRMSAPGFSDCTSWSAYDTEWEARVYLVEAYMDDEFVVIDVPTHFLSALVNDDRSSLTDGDEVDLEEFLERNREAHNITGSADESHFDGYQDMTECICQLPDDPPVQHRETNVEWLAKAMEYSRRGALIQAFIITAIDAYSKQVAAGKPEDFDNPMIAGAAWHDCGVELQEKLAARGL